MDSTADPEINTHPRTAPVRGDEHVARRPMVEVLINLQPLWVVGLALACLVFAAWILERPWIHVSGLRFAWGVYIVLGTIFPALLVTGALPPSRPAIAAPVARFLRRTCVLAAVVLLAYFAAAHGSPYLLIVAACQVGISWLILPSNADRVTLSRSVIALVTLIVSWSAAVRFMWWSDFDGWTLHSPYTFLVFVGSSLLVVSNVHRTRRLIPLSIVIGRRANLGLTLLGLLILAAASVRSTYLFAPSAFFNWGFWVGPAELVRQGGWLLWDDPSQYGFLSILPIALLPAGNVWQSFYILDSCAAFFAGAVIFLAFRSVRPGAINLAFSLSLATAAVFLLPGFPPSLAGPQWEPNVSSYRFLWCYALLAVLLWHARRSSSAAAATSRVMVVGCVIWLLGTLWSLESAIYASVIWLPAYGFLIAHSSDERRATRRSQALWALLPPGLLVATCTFISGVYVWRLGHGPDWSAFWEWSLSFGAGLDALPLDHNGPVWALLLINFASILGMSGLSANWDGRGLRLCALFPAGATRRARERFCRPSERRAGFRVMYYAHSREGHACHSGRQVLTTGLVFRTVS